MSCILDVYLRVSQTYALRVISVAQPETSPVPSDLPFCYLLYRRCFISHSLDNNAIR